MRNLQYALSLVFLLAIGLFAQEQQVNSTAFSGNLAIDSRALFYSAPVEKNAILPEPQSKKSVALAGVMSLVIPGSGEVYTGRYLEGAIFFAIDVAAISVAVTYQKKGDNKTNDFQNFANQHWDVVKYAKWLLIRNGKDTNVTWINHKYDASTANLKPWQRILDWNKLNMQEDSANFSHHLELYGQQQYYELIGKYHEYNAGWDAYNFAQQDYYNNTPSIVFFYETMRADANSFYNVNSKAVAIIYINHLLSAVNAMWDAVLYNKNIKLESSIETKSSPGITEYVPTMKVRWYF
jgi:hypothetical protein